MTGNTTICLHGRVFINKRALLVCVALDAGCVRARRQPCLLQLKTAMRVVAIAAFHRAFEYFVVERQVELMFGFTVTTYAQLRLIHLQQLSC